ncbi:unnamed protein product [Didymodactylos carnosus]|uniref:Uncharacterized protein n=1 Tax=Didymodactylos carnosus TaxID=1234261 RepID=A0A8S2UQ12_9BILA|nr:unnamed protein product [Didymodactylos carnosus]CAF4356913.1 unnamed protein product [Didymodactylos carnosus]
MTNVSNNSSEEETDLKEQLQKDKKARDKHQIAYERAFLDNETGKLKENIEVICAQNGRGRKLAPSLKKILDSVPKEQLEHLAKFAVRIGGRYEHGAVRNLITGSGMIIAECVITVTHLFNPIELDEQNEIVPYSRIIFTTTTLAPVSRFMSDHDEDIFGAEMIVRDSNGLKPLDIMFT